MLPGVSPTLANDAEFLPRLKKSWCFTFMVNDEDAPTRRPAGAIGWAGLANTFYWIHPKNGVGRVRAAPGLAVGDPTSLHRSPQSDIAAHAPPPPPAASDRLARAPPPPPGGL